jgi:2-polyprenyl-3-methyl-5-hydroxy-6-metoxy-1,4-benzoquinol methylase
MSGDYREHWKRYGDTDPYFGVLTDPRFHRAQLNEAALAEFWATGEAHVERVAALFAAHLGRELRPARSLDFGCGVGRVLLPLARRSGQAVGVDVSASMLAEARKAGEARGVRNVELREFAGSLSALPGPFDFVHSYIVLQHIPTPLGLRLLAELLALLSPGGLAMLQLTYAKPGEDTLRAMARRARAVLPLANGLANLFGRRSWGEPYMQMNAYDLNRVFLAFQRAGCHRVFTTYTDHGGVLGVALVAEKVAEPSL